MCIRDRCIRECGKFAVNILAEDSEPSLIGKFGFFSGKDTNKFQDVDFKIVEELPVLNDCLLYTSEKAVLDWVQGNCEPYLLSYFRLRYRGFWQVSFWQLEEL